MVTMLCGGGLAFTFRHWLQYIDRCLSSLPVLMRSGQTSPSIAIRKGSYAEDDLFPVVLQVCILRCPKTRSSSLLSLPHCSCWTQVKPIQNYQIPQESVQTITLQPHRKTLLAELRGKNRANIIELHQHSHLHGICIESSSLICSSGRKRLD